MNTEDFAKQIHTWYLEASSKLHPESFNPAAQKSYEELTEEQKYLDRYLAGKILVVLAVQRAELEKEIKQTIQEARLGITDYKYALDEIEEILFHFLLPLPTNDILTI